MSSLSLIFSLHLGLGVFDPQCLLYSTESMSTAPGDNVVSALLPLHRLTTLLSGGTKTGPSLLLSRGFQHGPLPGEALKGWGRVAPLTLTAGHPKGIKPR